MENILGLYLHKGYDEEIGDKFLAARIKQIYMTLDDFEINRTKFNSIHYERRDDIILREENKIYRELLRKLAEENDFFKGLENKVRNKIPEKTKKLIRIYLWKRMGREIPFGEINEEKAKKMLGEKGYSFLRIKNGRGWYLDGKLIGKIWQDAFEYSGENREDYV